MCPARRTARCPSINFMPSVSTDCHCAFKSYLHWVAPGARFPETWLLTFWQLPLSSAPPIGEPIDDVDLHEKNEYVSDPGPMLSAVLYARGDVAKARSLPKTLPVSVTRVLPEYDAIFKRASIQPSLSWIRRREEEANRSRHQYFRNSTFR